MTKSIGLRDNKASESDKGTQIQVKLIEIVKEQKKIKASPSKKIEKHFSSFQDEFENNSSVCLFVSDLCLESFFNHFF